MPFDGFGLESRGELFDKINQVIDLLSREDRWCKQQLRSYDGRRCILGAIMAADGVMVLKAPILTAINQVTGHSYTRIEVFNDQPLTTHSLVLEVLSRARANIVAGEPPPQPLADAPTATLRQQCTQLLARLRYFLG
ncbi:MAG TPA: hypothetical protein VLV85_13495 [Stellaceae bacterium]|jgi:hypothetical protein|nr:hypothetical protein [Stellaceae bacterium]